MQQASEARRELLAEAQALEDQGLSSEAAKLYEKDSDLFMVYLDEWGRQHIEWR